MILGWRLCALLTFAALCARLIPVRADDPVSSSVRFNREIIRIIQRRCEPCHAPGGLMMSLSNYRAARDWGRAIREELVEQRMPPSPVAPGYGRFQNDPNLTAREMMTLLTWLDGGMPRGDDSDLPAHIPHPTSHIPSADLRIGLPPQTVPAGENLVVRRVTVKAAGAPGQKLARVAVNPGDRRVFRGALVFTSTGAGRGNPQWIGAWLPWQHAIAPPSGHAFDVPADAPLEVQLYYRGADRDAIVDRSALEIAFAAENVRGRVEDVVIEVGRDSGERKLARAATVWALQPTMDESVRSLELRAQRPDGSVEILLWMPSVRPEWPLAMVLQDPMTFPAGTVLSLKAAPAAGAAGSPRIILSVLHDSSVSTAGGGRR